jgi:hypothetical protein
MKVQRKLRNGVAGSSGAGSFLDRQNRGKFANLSDAAGSAKRPRGDAGRDSTSCASPAPQLKREWSLLANFGRANWSYHEISNTWLAHGFLRSR